MIVFQGKGQSPQRSECMRRDESEWSLDAFVALSSVAEPDAHDFLVQVQTRCQVLVLAARFLSSLPGPCPGADSLPGRRSVTKTVSAESGSAVLANLWRSTRSSSSAFVFGPTTLQLLHSRWHRTAQQASTIIHYDMFRHQKSQTNNIKSGRQ